MKALLVLLLSVIYVCALADEWADCYGKPKSKLQAFDARAQQLASLPDLPIIAPGWIDRSLKVVEQSAEMLLGCKVPWGVGQTAVQWHFYIPLLGVCAPYATGVPCLYNCFRSADECAARCIERARPPVANCDEAGFGAAVGYELRYRYSPPENRCKLQRVSAACGGSAHNCYETERQCAKECGADEPGLPCQNDLDKMRLDVLSARVVNKISRGCGAPERMGAGEDDCWTLCIDKPACLMAAHERGTRRCYLYGRSELYDRPEMITMSDGRRLPQIACSYCYDQGGGASVAYTILEKSCAGHKGRRRRWRRRRTLPAGRRRPRRRQSPAFGRARRYRL